ncbi:hypothetical protein BMW26_11280 [Microbacterium sp. 1.5R]|uniref:hypothetical protein n=1 Tax=Microbacterium sp. 1.5R TaxID=1916917 RepID=UPI00090A4B31|nr:hypothetical protein [Microbacterium sp. 1.5R]APH45469.1 hypothetical protein BMW26_11280 [Microbacterium sp. 1.5R]
MTEEYPAGVQRIVARITDPWPATVEVSPGWYPLLESLEHHLAALAPDYVVHQVKSKFGALSFFAASSTNPEEYSEEFNAAILAAEWKSIVTCELCGAPARQYTIQLWTWTLCATHSAEKSA